MANGLLSTREAEEAAQDVVESIESLEAGSIGLLLGALSFGAIAAQEVAERVLVFMEMPRTPSTGRHLGVSVLAKLVFAILIATIAVSFSGLGLAVAAFTAVGSLTSAGVDAWQMLQRGGIPGQDTRSQSRSQADRRTRRRQQHQPSASDTSSGGEDLSLA